MLPGDFRGTTSSARRRPLKLCYTTLYCHYTIITILSCHWRAMWVTKILSCSNKLYVVLCSIVFACLWFDEHVDKACLVLQLRRVWRQYLHYSNCGNSSLTRLMKTRGMSLSLVDCNGDTNVLDKILDLSDRLSTTATGGSWLVISRGI